MQQIVTICDATSITVICYSNVTTAGVRKSTGDESKKRNYRWSSSAVGWYGMACVEPVRVVVMHIKDRLPCRRVCMLLNFTHEEVSGGDNYYLYWKGPDSLNAWQITSPKSTFFQFNCFTNDKVVSFLLLETDYTRPRKAWCYGLLNLNVAIRE